MLVEFIVLRYELHSQFIRFSNIIYILLISKTRKGQPPLSPVKMQYNQSQSTYAASGRTTGHFVSPCIEVYCPSLRSD